MGFVEAIGCALIAFSAPLSLFIFFVASDPLRVIIFVGSAFFWLLSLLVSSLIWVAVVPLRDQVVFGVIIAVLCQEIFRYLYYLLLKKAESGLEKLSAKGMHIDGVHSLKNAKHTMAFVCGLAYGVMSGIFALANILSYASGPGTLGLPKALKLSDHFGDYTFFLLSTLSGAAFIILNIAWSVIFWNACEKANYFVVLLVVSGHLMISCLTMLNKMGFYYVTIPILYGTVITLVWVSYIVAGGSWKKFKNFLKHSLSCSFLVTFNDEFQQYEER